MSYELRKDYKNRLTPSEKRALTYEKEPVESLDELWERYPEGGEYGWYCLVIKAKSFAHWDDEIKDWSLNYAGRTLKIVARFGSVNELITAFPDGSLVDGGCLVDGIYYYWDTYLDSWEIAGPIEGSSAYQIAVENGFIGTEQEWLESLSKDSKEAALLAKQAIEDTILATKESINQTIIAKNASDLANEKANLADQKALEAEAAASKVNDSIQEANLATSNANKAATDAEIAISDFNVMIEGAKETVANTNKVADLALSAAKEAENQASLAENSSSVAKEKSELARAAAERANELSDNPTKIVNDYWWKYNETLKRYENTGLKAKGDSVGVTDSLISTSTTEALSAYQGYILNEKIFVLNAISHKQNTDTGTDKDTFQIGTKGIRLKNSSGVLELRDDSDIDYCDILVRNLTAEGDLIVKGKSFVVNAETVEVSDNTILLNKGEAGAGVTKGVSGLEVDRGSLPKYQIIFDESDDRFKVGIDGDLWPLTLRDNESNLTLGMFLSWDGKKLVTTNIIHSDQKLFFASPLDKDGTDGYVQSLYSAIKEPNDSAIVNNSGDFLILQQKSNWLRLGNSNATVYTFNTSAQSFLLGRPLLLSKRGQYYKNAHVSTQIASDLLTIGNAGRVDLIFNSDHTLFSYDVKAPTFIRVSDNSEALFRNDVKDDLESDSIFPLSQRQGVVLKNLINFFSEDLNSYLPLTAGAGKTLTGNLYTNAKIITGYYNGDNTSTSGYCSKDANGNEQFVLFIDSTGTVLGNNATPVMIRTSPNVDINHYITGERSYRMWDERNLPNPAKATDLNNYLPLSAGNGKPLTGKLYANGGVKLSVKGVSLTGVNSTGREEALIYISSTDDVVVGDQRDNLVLHSVASDLIHRRGASAEYKIWDAYNLSSPATTTDLNSYIPRSAQGVTTSLLNLQGGIYRGGASMDGEFGYACNMLLRFDSGGTNWYTGGILSISTGGELRVAGVSNGTLSVWRDVAMQGMSNNFLHSGNEVTFISQAAALPGVWLNYRGCAGGITDYLLGSGKADGSYANLKVKNLYTSESIYIPNGQKLKSYSSEGNIVDMAYVAPGSNILVLGHLSTPGVLIRSTNTDIYHARNVGGTATNYKIWDAYNLSSPVTGSGGVSGQIAKWSGDATLSGGIAYSSGNVASTVVARDGNGAFAATSISVTNLNATNLGTGGNATTIHVGLIPRAVNTCYIGSADRPFAQMYSAHFNGHLAGSADFCCDKRVEVVTAIPSTTLANTVYFLT